MRRPKNWRSMRSFTVAELLRNGITTFVEFGSQLRVQQALLEAVGELGIRAYLGPGFDSGRWVGGDGGKLDARGSTKPRASANSSWRSNSSSATRAPTATASAASWCRARSRPAPSDLMRKAAAGRARARPAGRDPCRLQHPRGVRHHPRAPDDVDRAVAARRPDVGPAQHRPRQLHRRQSADELFRVARPGDHGHRHRCSISHCPVNIARRGRFLDSWQTYRKAGVNIALGTDTYPRDMILQMRNASYFGKVASRNLQGRDRRARCSRRRRWAAPVRSDATTSAGWRRAPAPTSSSST